METDSPNSNSLVDNLIAEVQCNICLEMFEDPRSLGCGHTFCKACLDQCEKKQLLSSIIECPMCRFVHKLDRKGVDGLNKNRYLANIIEKLKEAQAQIAVPFPYNLYVNPSSSPPPSSYPLLSPEPNGQAYPILAPPSQTLNTISLPPQTSLYPNYSKSEYDLPTPSAPPIDDTSSTVTSSTRPLDDSLYPPLENRNPSSLPPTNPELHPPPLPEKTPEQRKAAKENEKEEVKSTSFLGTIFSFFTKGTETKEAPKPQTQEMVPHYAPFEVRSSQCRTIFYKWVSSLWFTPSDFAEKVSLSHIQYVYVPFWIFSVNTASVYSGLVCHHERTQDGKLRERWSAASGVQNCTYKNVMVCGDTEQNSIVMEHLLSFSDWNINKATLTQPQVDAKEDHYLQHSVAWTKASSTILKKEEELCAAKLIRDERAEKLQDFSLTSLQFQNLTQTLVFLPVFLTSYVYNGSEYRIVISAQTGVLKGQRPPYGLGKLGSFVFSKK